MTIEALLELKRTREADIAFVRDNYKDFAEWRGELSQTEVCKALDVPNTYVGKFEDGNIEGIGREALRKLVDLYVKFKEMNNAN